MAQYSQSRDTEYQPDESYRASGPDQQSEGINPTLVSLPPRRKGWFVWIVLALFAVAGIIFAGFQYITKYQQPAEPEKPAITTEEKELPGYKRYTSEDSPLSFSYPENWSYMAFDEGMNVFLTDFQLSTAGRDITQQDFIEPLPWLLLNENAIIRISLMDIQYNDADLLAEKFGSELFSVLVGEKNVYQLENAALNGRAVKMFDSRTQKPRHPDGESYIFPVLKFYCFDVDIQSVCIALRVIQLEKYEEILTNIASTIKVSPLKREFQTYNKNGLYFIYPSDWDLYEEWSRRGGNLSQVDIDPPYLEAESYADRSIRIYIRPLGESITSHQVVPSWKSTEFIIDGHKGKRYQNISSRLGSYEPITQEHIVIPLNNKYELAIWSESAEIHKLLLDKISQEMKINLDELEKAVGNIKPYP